MKKKTKYRIMSLALLFSVLVIQLLTAQIEIREIELSLEEALLLAIRLNPRVGEAKLEWLISENNLRIEWGEFEPDLTAYYDVRDTNRQNNVQEVIQQLGNSDYEEDTEEYSVGLEGKTFSGGKYQFGFTFNKKKGTFNTENEYNSFIGITVVQPLLKGATRGVPRAGINIAKRDRSIAFHKYRKLLMEILMNVESAYWKLTYAQNLYVINLESVEIAKKLVEDYRDRLETGKISQLDFLEAEGLFTLREVALAESNQRVQDAMMELKLLISEFLLEEDYSVTTTDSLIGEKLSFTPPGQEEMKQMIDRHPDYLIRQLELERETILKDYYKDQSLPQLDLIGSYNFMGLGESFQDSWSVISSQTNPSWSLKTEFRMPLFMGLQEQRRLEGARLKVRLRRQLQEATGYEVGNSISLMLQQIASFLKRIDNTRKVVEVKEKLRDVELARLEAGFATSRTVYSAEEEVYVARQDELESILQYRLALSRLGLVGGTALEERNLEKQEGSQFFLSAELLKE